MKINAKFLVLALCWLTVAPTSAVADSAEGSASSGDTKQLSAGWVPPISAFTLYSDDLRMVRASDFVLPESKTDKSDWPEPEVFEMTRQEIQISRVPAGRPESAVPAKSFFQQLRSFMERPVGETQTGVVYVGVTSQGYAGIYLRKRRPTLEADALVPPAAPRSDPEL